MLKYLIVIKIMKLLQPIYSFFILELRHKAREVVYSRFFQDDRFFPLRLYHKIYLPYGYANVSNLKFYLYYYLVWLWLDDDVDGEILNHDVIDRLSRSKLSAKNRLIEEFNAHYGKHYDIRKIKTSLTYKLLAISQQRHLNYEYIKLLTFKTNIKNTIPTGIIYRGKMLYKHKNLC